VWNTHTGNLQSTLVDLSGEKSVLVDSLSQVLYVASAGEPIKKFLPDTSTGQGWSSQGESLSNTSGWLFGSAAYSEGQLIVPLISSGNDNGRLVNIRHSSENIFEISQQRDLWDMAVSGNMRWIATSYGTEVTTDPKIWSTVEKHVVASLPIGPTGNIIFSPDSRWVSATGLQGLGLWATDTWKSAPILSAQVREQGLRATFSPDSKTIAISLGEEIHLIELESGRVLAVLRSRLLPSSNFRLRFSPAGNYLAAQGHDNSIQIWNLDGVQNELTKYDLSW
jgi:WD40 repeat protein